MLVEGRAGGVLDDKGGVCVGGGGIGSQGLGDSEKGPGVALSVEGGDGVELGEDGVGRLVSAVQRLLEDPDRARGREHFSKGSSAYAN